MSTLISGFYYAENSSKKHAATMSYEQGFCTLSIEGEIINKTYVDDLNISARLGNMQRQIRFDGGQLFETESNDDIDALLKLHQKHSFPALLHTLESKLTYVFPLLLFALIIGWGSYTWGLPKIVNVAAFSLPSSELSMMGEHTLTILDQGYLSPSKLNANAQQEIRKRFDKLTSEISSGFQYQLYFRRMPNNLANAFALPDGSIVLMDGLVDLAEHPWEIDSVLLHEIGHVEQRHSLQMVLQDTLITLIASMMLGDAVSTTDAIAALPILLLENQYSQHFEQDSDDFSSNYMLNHNVDTTHFSNMLQKLDDSYSAQKEKMMPDDNDANTSFWDYFSTHPDTQKRIQRLQEKQLRKL